MDSRAVAVKTFLTCSNKIITAELANNTSLCRDSREKYFNSFITLGGGGDRAISLCAARNEIRLLKQTNIIAANQDHLCGGRKPIKTFRVCGDETENSSWLAAGAQNIEIIMNGNRGF
jgi:hypothetical protein